jgi:hypothetical protein
MKLPIRIRNNRFDSVCGLEDEAGRSVCAFQWKGLPAEQIAPFIVRACNSHAALVAALERAEFNFRSLANLGQYTFDKAKTTDASSTAFQIKNEAEKAQAEARAALNAAKEGQ